MSELIVSWHTTIMDISHTVTAAMNMQLTRMLTDAVRMMLTYMQKLDHPKHSGKFRQF